MKKLKVFTCILAVVTAGTVWAAPTTTTTTTTSTTPVIFPTSLPIESKGTLRSYAMELIAGGYIGVHSNGMIHDGDDPGGAEVSYGSFQSNDRTELLSMMRTLVFRFSVASEKDNVFGYAGLQDADYNQLFYSGTTVPLVKQSNGTWALSPSAFLSFKMSSIPVATPGVISGRVIYRNDDKSIYTITDLNVYDGKTFIPPEIAGKPVQIVLTGYDAQGVLVSQIYSSTGIKSDTVRVSGKIEVGFENFAEVSDVGSPAGSSLNAAVIANQYSERTGDLLDPPLIEVTLASSRTVQVLGALYHGDGLLPSKSKHFFVRQKGQSQIVTYNAVQNGIGYTPIVLLPGVYYITFDFEEFEDRSLPPIWYGGGKG